MTNKRIIKYICDAYNNIYMMCTYTYMMCIKKLYLYSIASYASYDINVYFNCQVSKQYLL